ncbi:MAG: alkaline phosphatase family protein [bacterium]
MNPRSNMPRVVSIAALVLMLAIVASCGGERTPKLDAPSAGAGAATGSAAAPPSRAPSNEAASPPAADLPMLDAAEITTRAKRVKRLFIFALDGATWHIMTPLLDAGKMPNTARLIANGVRAELATIEPTLSPAIWTTIATGVLPVRHGIHGFDGVPGMTMKTLPNSRMRKVKAYWNILADFGRTTGTFCWWVTWPADDVGDGSFQVSDRVPYTRMEAAIRRAGLSPDDTYPPELIEKLSPLIERPNQIDPAIAAKFLKMSKTEMQETLLAADYRMGDYLSEFKFVFQSDRSTLKMALDLLKTQPVDIAAVYLTGIDTMSHLYWHWSYPEEFSRYQIPQADIDKYKDVIPLYYELMDDYLGQLLKVVGSDATVMILSDHGFGGTGKLPWSGGHGSITPGAPLAPPGVLVLSGPGIASGGATLPGAHVLDIAPTILYLMGLPASQEMTGRVIVEALAPGSPPELPRVASYERVGRARTERDLPEDPAGDAERIERLRALGYIQ